MSRAHEPDRPRSRRDTDILVVKAILEFAEESLLRRLVA
jgi:hypothetical protein